MSDIEVTLNDEVLADLAIQITSNLSTEGIEVSCPYCNGKFTALTDSVICPHCNKQFDFSFNL